MAENNGTDLSIPGFMAGMVAGAMLPDPFRGFVASVLILGLIATGESSATKKAMGQAPSGAFGLIGSVLVGMLVSGFFRWIAVSG